MRTNLRNRGLGLVVLLPASIAAFGQVFTSQDGSVPPPPRPPARIQLVKGKIGDWIFAGTIRYRVVDTMTGLRSYKMQFNQSGKKLHPGFPSDRLAAIELEIENRGDRPIEPPVFMAALTDSDGARGTDWILDARQQAFLEESTRGGRAMSRIPAQIGVKQTMTVALVFSVSPKAKPTLLEFSPENFRDMPFGQPGRYGGQPGRFNGQLDGTPPPQRQFGPRRDGPPPPPRDVFRISVDLTHGK